MPAVRYVAKRSITGGRLLGQQYTFDVDCVSFSPSQRTIGTNVVSITGKTQTVIERREKYWQFVTDRLRRTTPEYGQFYEFMESVDEGETFEIDADGTVASPVLFESVIIDGNYQRTRVDQTEEFTFTFSVRVLP